MIIVRNTFHMDAMRMKEAATLANEGRELVQRLGFPVPRISVDLASEFYTLVLETEFEPLADFESRLPQNRADWEAWYSRFNSLVRSGRREVFRVLD